jgi:ankyrin repeat protein
MSEEFDNFLCKQICDPSKYDLVYRNNAVFVIISKNEGIRVISQNIQLCNLVTSDKIEIIKSLLTYRRDKLMTTYKHNFHPVNFMLNVAARVNNIEIMNYLLETQPDNFAMLKAFRFACMFGKLDIAKQLLENRDYDKQSIKKTLNSLLSVCISYDYYEIVELLLNLDADVNYCENNSLIVAVKNGRIEIVKLLLKRGADVNAQNNLALAEANRKQNQEMITLLT